VRSSGLAFTFLRDSMYLDFLPGMASPEGVIAGPAGEGRVGAVARDDVADVAVAVLTGDGHDGRTYDVTGPEALTLTDVAAQLGEAAGREVVFRNETLSEAYASRAHHGAPDFAIDGWVTSYAAIATGELDVVTDVVPRLTGHPAQSLRELVAAHPESVAHLRRA
jgi:NAD(P)H dehydrogenase (quinone)